ncbi:D-tyrosyl-tRNA(Tyr) deacylase [Chitinispirillum alkaliphilum]|nr:D-tyrosyl-tRNA(Tyr) deacylase [Chitinispirillum alkaliphilum]
MRTVIQRVSRSKVSVKGETKGSIERGLLILLGVHENDTEENARYLASKIASLRIFPDEKGKMNLSLKDIDGEALVVSQFTLLGDCSKGRRPSFTESAPPQKGEKLYEFFVEKLKTHISNVQTGEFGADMKVELTNDGPVTFVIDK